MTSFVMDGWTLVPNPGYTGDPRLLESVCHDRSPFLTLACTKCGEPMHIHETQLAGAPNIATVDTRCPSCSQMAVASVQFFREAFQQMRDDGWIL